jgi:hypothetical protein
MDIVRKFVHRMDRETLDTVILHQGMNDPGPVFPPSMSPMYYYWRAEQWIESAAFRPLRSGMDKS